VHPAEPQDPDQLLADLAGRVPEVRHALVVSADGVALATSGPALAGHLERLAAITSSLISLAAGAATVSGSGPVTQAVVVMEQGTFVIMAVDEGASLAVLTAADADLDQVAYEMTMLVERSASTLTSPARGPDLSPP
jgi:predicted regulator of Ras-like GTPase activity (Roadblock/LC7/MglB family)